MSIEVRAAEIHQDATLTPDQLVSRSREIAVSADIVPLTIIKLGDASRNLDVHVPTLQAIAAQSAKLQLAALVISNVSTFVRGAVAALQAGESLLDVMTDPQALLGLATGLLPATLAKDVHVALTLVHDVLSLTRGGKDAGVTIIKDLAGVAGLFSAKNPNAGLTDVLLGGFSAIVGGQDFALDRFLPGALIAVSKDLLAQAGVLKDPGGDL